MAILEKKKRKLYVYMPKVPVHAMSKSCRVCSLTSGAQCIRLKRGEREQAVALAGTTNLQLPPKFWSLCISTQRGYQELRSGWFMRLWLYHLSISIQGPKTVLEQVMRVIELFDFAESRPVVSETSFSTFGWFVPS